MTGENGHSSASTVWKLANRQHGLVTHAQLLDTGFTRHAIAHRLRKGRLHRIWRGVYAVGRPELSALGRYMAAVLSCGPSAVLSHDSAAALWELRRQRRREVDVSMPSPLHPRRPGIVIHRRTGLTARGVTVHRGIPVTTPVCTLVDLATRLDREELEAAVNEADRLDLADPETVRTAIDATASRGGVRALRVTLDLRPSPSPTRRSSGASCDWLAGLDSRDPRPGGS
jgi:predicted transcriptional regulator of viral defense system